MRLGCVVSSTVKILIFIFQINLNELKDKASFLASSDLKKDSKIKQLENLLEQKSDEVSRFESQLKTVSI